MTGSQYDFNEISHSLYATAVNTTRWRIFAYTSMFFENQSYATYPVTLTAYSGRRPSSDKSPRLENINNKQVMETIFFKYI